MLSSLVFWNVKQGTPEFGNPLLRVVPEVFIHAKNGTYSIADFADS